MCHNSKSVIFQERILKVLKCCNFLWVQWRHNCSPAASFANCVMTLYLLKVHLQAFLNTPIIKKCQILSCDTLVANQRYVGRKTKPITSHQKGTNAIQVGQHHLSCHRMHFLHPRSHTQTGLIKSLSPYRTSSWKNTLAPPPHTHTHESLQI